jgi:hypothetical protein
MEPNVESAACIHKSVQQLVVSGGVGESIPDTHWLFSPTTRGGKGTCPVQNVQRVSSEQSGIMRAGNSVFDKMATKQTACCANVKMERSSNPGGITAIVFIITRPGPKIAQTKGSGQYNYHNDYALSGSFLASNLQAQKLDV